MKRTIMAIAVALMTAVLDGGDIKPDLAQTANASNANDFASSIPISGASGQSKGSSIGAGKEWDEPNHAGNIGGASVWWTWVAPATGGFAFDTRGSNFDTLLAVYTGDILSRFVEIASNDDGSVWTLQSAVHFRAQRGQTYHVAVDGYGGKSGTVVLNWQASSADSGNSGSDAFRRRASLSGASGWSAGINVGAGIESGEPRHAGNIGGASVWWTWTAPTTGPAAFNTRGSDFDTLLAVYTGDSLDLLTEIASNNDASGGETIQSEVRFSAQEGRTYHIAVDGYGGATGAIVLNWRTASAASSLRIAVFETPKPGKPSYVIDGQNASLQYWKTPNGAVVSQMLYAAVNGTVSTRIFYDAVTGLPRKILDQFSGDWVLIQESKLYGVDFWLYDRDGNYQSGFAVYEEDSQYHFGEIVGLPVHAGEQITGQLQSDSGAVTGTFTLDIGADDLINIQTVPPEIAATADGLVPTSVHMRSGANEDEGTIAHSERLSGVGMALLALGEATGSGPWAMSGAVGLVSRGFMSPAVLRNRRQPCGEVDVRAPEDACLAAAGHLASGGSGDPLGYVVDVLEGGGQPPTELVERGRQALAHAEGTHSSLDQPLQSVAHQPIARPPTTASPVSGYAHSNFGASVQVAESISVERGRQALAHAEGTHSSLDQPPQSAAHEPIAVDQPPTIATPVAGQVVFPDAVVQVAGSSSPDRSLECTITRHPGRIPWPDGPLGWRVVREIRPVAGGGGIEVCFEIYPEGEVAGQVDLGTKVYDLVGRITKWVADRYLAWDSGCTGSCPVPYQSTVVDQTATYRLMTEREECGLEYRLLGFNPDSFNCRQRNDSSPACWCCPDKTVGERYGGACVRMSAYDPITPRCGWERVKWGLFVARKFSPFFRGCRWGSALGVRG